MWDSQKVESANTVNIECQGSPLESNRKYYWHVCAVINGKEEWSSTAYFHMGLLDQLDWKSHWISAKEELLYESPLFRKQFAIGKEIKDAHVYVASAGLDDSNWHVAVITQSPVGKLKAQTLPIRVTDTLMPVAEINFSIPKQIFMASTLFSKHTC